MHKLMLVFNLLVSVFRVNYVDVEYIECYANYKEKIRFDFSFNSDSTSNHNIYVLIELYDLSNKKIVEYSNSLTIIGDKKVSASIDYLYQENLYALISIKCDDIDLINYLRFDFYKSQSCELNNSNRICNSFYKNRYSKSILSEKYMNFKILKAPFDAFLTYNKLDLQEFGIYSEYDFSLGEIHLVIEEKIDEYNIGYNGKYTMPLEVIKEGNYYRFSLLEAHYFSVYPFEFSELYKEGYYKTNNIYFPFTSDYREYELKIVIEGITSIEIKFNVSVSDNLFGECESSKYCLVRVSDV